MPIEVRMVVSWVGLGAATAAFLGIWLGHVSVRKIEAAAPDLRLPIFLAMAAGLGLTAASLWAPGRLPSAVLGVLGITVLWDAYELVRQEKRVRRGHAPANPRNPRHAVFLAQGSATTVDLLKREPGRAPSNLPHFQKTENGGGGDGMISSINSEDESL